MEWQVCQVLALPYKTRHIRSARVNFSECIVYVLWPVMINRFSCVLCQLLYTLLANKLVLDPRFITTNIKAHNRTWLSECIHPLVLTAYIVQLHLNTVLPILSRSFRYHLCKVLHYTNFSLHYNYMSSPSCPSRLYCLNTNK
jgi:hypothetical protein